MAGPMVTGASKERRGDGSPLRALGRWHFVWRTVMGIDHAGVRWDIDVDFFDPSENVRLYRDGIQDRVQRGTADFDVGGGDRLEAAWSAYGLRRARLVLRDGTVRQLEPAHGTAERWRADLDANRPAASRLLSATSWTVLVLALVLQLPQLVQTVAEVTHWFAFTAPVTLPAWLNTPMTVAGVLAAIERALRLRHHWLLD